MPTVIDAVQADLRARIEPGYREAVRDQFKLDVDTYWGVRVGGVRAVSAAHFPQVKRLSFAEVLRVCNALLEAYNYEQKLIAFDWAYRFRRHFTAKHFAVFERFATEVMPVFH